MRIAGIVLAGGQSRRMGGREKSLLELGGQDLLSRAVEALEPQVAMMAINANGDASRFEKVEHPVIADTVEGFVGPLAGVLTGMRWAVDHSATHIATAAADTPFFPDDLVDRLSSALTGMDDIAMAQSVGRVHPVFGLWPVRLADALERFLVQEDKRKILEFANRYTLHEVEFDSSEDPFFNINTPDDLSKAEKRVASRG